MNRLSIVSIALGATMLVGSPLAWHLSQPTAEVGELPAATSTEAPEAAPDVVLATPPTNAEDGRDTTGGEQGSDATTVPVPAPPRQLRLPSLGIDAPVVDVGLEDGGAMEIPHDISTVGWYELGVTPGAASGTAVIAGHVDSREQGRGALFELRTMDVDDTIEVEHADGAVTQWRVVARRSFPKEELPITDLFTRSGEPRLVLITCGGEFDRSARRYADNIVVYAVPVDA